MSTGSITSWFNIASGRFDSPVPTYNARGELASPTNAKAQPDAAAAAPPAAVSQLAVDQANKDLAGMPGMQQINQQAVAAADPFAPQRAQYQNQLAQLMQGNFSANDPSYKARFEGGQQALERSAAAKGMLGSGNVLQALQDYGQGMASQEFQNQYNRLVPLTGATTGSPSAAGALTGQLYDWRNNALASLGGGMAGLAAQQPPSPVSNQILGASFGAPMGSTGQQIGYYQGKPLYQGHS
jgi:hypothetical protein